MPPRRFHLRFDDDDTTFYCAAFESEAEREQTLAGAYSMRPAVTPASTDSPLDEQRPRGRPSFDAMLEAAVKVLRRKLARRDSLSARARLVLRHLAETHDAENMPAPSTVRAFLAERPIAEKPAEKSADKSERVKMRHIGG